ncbi:MAG: 4'-phosphopantetheinyl transferase superfamily protein [Kofleriaceae bacterium]|nr:4'-phosphopantetheinyl transferase superfamily protein [Kofleriaceae bacterium]
MSPPPSSSTCRTASPWRSRSTRLTRRRASPRRCRAGRRSTSTPRSPRCAPRSAHAAALTPVRRRDWVAGAARARRSPGRRRCAWPLLADDRGAPVLPAGVLGSVSHKAGLAVALATGDGAAAGWRVGVDVEAVTGARVDISRRILTDAELAEVAGLDGEARARAVALRFSIKEAVYKAIDPFVRRYVGFREVAVWPGGGAVAAGVATVDSALPVVVEAAWIELGDLWICSARARAR